MYYCPPIAGRRSKIALQLCGLRTSEYNLCSLALREITELLTWNPVLRKCLGVPVKKEKNTCTTEFVLKINFFLLIMTVFVAIMTGFLQHMTACVFNMTGIILLPSYSIWVRNYQVSFLVQFYRFYDTFFLLDFLDNELV